MRVLLLFLGLVSCSTFSKKDCLQADWHEIGLQDGRQGRPFARFKELEAICAKHQLPADRDSYAKGREEGLERFCTPEYGEVFGESGGEYQNVCPSGVEGEFLKRYLFGKQKYDLKVRERDVQRRERELDRRKFTGSRSCTFNSDCDVTGFCEQERCSNSGRRCTFATDCTVRGSCSFGRCHHN